MLGLLRPTDPRWVEVAQGQLDALLSDHAHCELKAALSALSVVARFGGEAPQLVAPLTALAKEETVHFAQVHAELAGRGSELAPPGSDAYVCKLKAATGQDRSHVPLLLDRLLVGALIEARSCERFKLLSERLDSPVLRTFYRDLMESEARHYRLFRDLAEDIFGAHDARRRLATLARREADIVAALPLEPTVHG